MKTMNIAVLITVFNRIEKTKLCLESLYAARIPIETNFTFKVFLTDDGSTDGTSDIIKSVFCDKNIEILQGSGTLYWNAGMNNSWRAAIKEGGFDGYLWLNNDSLIYPNVWEEIVSADKYAHSNYSTGGIYIGSTKDPDTQTFSYGGFIFKNKWILKDIFLEPNGKFQLCQAGHGNITYVSQDVVDQRGTLCDKYIHGVGDHDYTYLAYKHGFPVLVLRAYVGECENDHTVTDITLSGMNLKERIAYVKKPLGYNLNNTLLFQKRCFPHRYPFVWLTSYFRLLFPQVYYKIYTLLRK